MEEILGFMRARLNEEHYEKFKYAFDSGKRVRPMLMKSICESIGKDFHPLLAAASAVEVMHCVSLMHDDIVDNSEVRREKESFYMKYGTNSAVLFGDLFATMAIEIFEEEYGKEIHLEFIRSFKSMIEGQIMEMENKVVDAGSYFEYVGKKTSSLFELCAKAPLLYYGVDDDRIVEFSKEFGLLFQIANDISGNKGEISILNFMTEEEAKELFMKKLESVRKFQMPHMNRLLGVFDGLVTEGTQQE